MFFAVEYMMQGDDIVTGIRDWISLCAKKRFTVEVTEQSCLHVNCFHFYQEPFVDCFSFFRVKQCWAEKTRVFFFF